MSVYITGQNHISPGTIDGTSACRGMLKNNLHDDRDWSILQAVAGKIHSKSTLTPAGPSRGFTIMMSCYLVGLYIYL